MLKEFQQLRIELNVFIMSSF